MTGTCRECRQRRLHKLGCSRRRYGAKVIPDEADTVAEPHEPVLPYCPGPDVECHYSGTPGDFCQYTGGTCYFVPEVSDL